jgi:hypothetical protein
MKKLQKLQINSEKLMKNEELITLRGGYEGNCCFCHSCVHDGYMIATSQAACASACSALGCQQDWLC